MILIDETFAESLKQEMARLKLKQRDLADATGIPRGRISEYVTGRRKPSHDNLNKIRAAINKIRKNKPPIITTLAELRMANPPAERKGEVHPGIAYGAPPVPLLSSDWLEDYLHAAAEHFGMELNQLLELGRSIVEGGNLLVAPASEVAAYLNKARSVLEGPKGEALKTVIDSMIKE